MKSLPKFLAVALMASLFQLHDAGAFSLDARSGNDSSGAPRFADPDEALETQFPAGNAPVRFSGGSDAPSAAMGLMPFNGPGSDTANAFEEECTPGGKCVMLPRRR